MSEMKDKKRGGYYWEGDKPYLSTTQILSVIDKPALRWWFGQQVYLAMVQNPNLSQQEALSAPYKKSDSAKSRGSTVHSIVEVYKKGAVDFDKWVNTIDKGFQGYAHAFNNFVKDFHVKIVDQEKWVKSDKHRFAGTLDLIVELNGEKKVFIGDVKTGKRLYPEVALQLSSYAMAYKEQGGAVDGLFGVLLQEDGTYTYKQMKDEIDGFLACKTLYESIHREDLEKIGYYGGEE